MLTKTDVVVVINFNMLENFAYIHLKLGIIIFMWCVPAAVEFPDFCYC